MSEQFLHGVEVVQIDNGARPIQTVRSSVIGVIGTAPEADASVFPVNTPVLIAGSLLGSLKWPVNPMTPSARRWLMLAGLGAGLVLGLLGVALRLGWVPRLSAVFLPG